MIIISIAAVESSTVTAMTTAEFVFRKFILVRLPKLSEDNTIYMDYRYINHACQSLSHNNYDAITTQFRC